MKAYREMTDEEVTVELRYLKRSSRSKEELKRRIMEELGCPYEPAIASTSCGKGNMMLIMFMVMIHGPRGNVISA